MRRANTPTGSKFTVRGQVYIQTGAFFHPMSYDREVRVLELDTTCPECGDSFQATASIRQISTRQLVRRCPVCREIHSGPVKLAPGPPKAATRKSTRKATTDRKQGKVRRRRTAAVATAATILAQTEPPEPARQVRPDLSALD
jgi:hypothetical protein